MARKVAHISVLDQSDRRTHDQTDHLPRVMSAQIVRSYRSPKVHQLDQFLITLNRMKFSV